MKTIAGVLFAAGLGLAGCAVDPEADGPAASAPAESTASQAVLTGVQCSDKQWRVNFYSDASHTNLVGWMSCTCFGPEDLEGSESSFTALAFEFDCSLE